ncbi:MAG: signal peptidase II [bacterium]
MKLGHNSVSTRRRTIVKWSTFLASTAAALVVDVVTKRAAEQQLALGETHKILPFLSLERTTNTGVAFGLLSGRLALIIAANAVALLIVLFYVSIDRRPLLAGISGGLIVGGSLGNLVQRVGSDGQVTDFLKFPRWPNYNMADVFIFAGIAVIFLGLVLEAVRVWKAGRQTPASR